MDGHFTTVVHDPHGSNLIAGEGPEILVDPQQPGYAELPDQPFGQNWQWIFAGCFSLAIALVGVLPQVSMIVHTVGRYRRRGTLIGEHTQRALDRRLERMTRIELALSTWEVNVATAGRPANAVSCACRLSLP